MATPAQAGGSNPVGGGIALGCFVAALLAMMERELEAVEDVGGRVDGQAEQAQGRGEMGEEAPADDVDGRLNEAVEDSEADIGPGEPEIDAAAEAHQRKRQRDRVEQGRLLHQMVVVVRLPLHLRLDHAVEIAALASDPA